MDPVTIAAGAIALLGPFFGKAGSEFAGEAGKAAWRLASRILDRIRSAVQDKPDERKALEDFSREPDASAESAQLMLRSLLEKDPGLARELDDMLQSVKRLGPGVSVVQRVKDAEEVVGVKARRIRSGSVMVDQEVDKAGSVTGATIEDDIG